MVQSIVAAVYVIQNANTNWTTTLVMVAYDLGVITIKSARLSIQSVNTVVTPTMHWHQQHMAQQLDHLMATQLQQTICHQTSLQ